MTVYVIGFCFFFFSSRRRHTRWTGDWSSDVCSSDLLVDDARHLDVRPLRFDLDGALTQGAQRVAKGSGEASLSGVLIGRLGGVGRAREPISRLAESGGDRAHLGQ